MYLLDCHRLGQVTGEVDIESFLDSKPVGDELEWNNVKQTLENVDGLWDLDLLGVFS